MKCGRAQVARAFDIRCVIQTTGGPRRRRPPAAAATVARRRCSQARREREGAGHLVLEALDVVFGAIHLAFRHAARALLGLGRAARRRRRAEDVREVRAHAKELAAHNMAHRRGEPVLEVPGGARRSCLARSVLRLARGAGRESGPRRSGGCSETAHQHGVRALVGVRGANLVRDHDL
jgi:hypothetical protein